MLKAVKVTFLVLSLIIIFSGIVIADPLPDINIMIDNDGTDVKVADSIKIILLLTVLTLAPSILIMMTSFTRFIIVLGFVRRALSLQSTPPNQTLIGLSLFMTLFVMAPVFSTIYEEAYQPLQAGEITMQQAVERGQDPLHEFMLRQVRSKDLALFINIDGKIKPNEIEDNKDIPLRVLIPAFILSELKLGFEIGFLIFLPFIVIDMIVASTLMALGMMMLPPVMVSLPIKILLFVMVDGWNLIVDKLIMTIR